MKRRYCLVLGGGGTKGSYEMGVWRALRELKIPLEAVIGTSIGAINALWIAQNDFEEAQEIWNNLTIEKVLTLPPGYQSPPTPLKASMATFHVIGQIMSERGQLDNQPLRDLVQRSISLEKLQKSKIDLGLVTFNVSTMRPEEVFREDVLPDAWPQYIMASAAFPGFVPTKIQGKTYLDGGVWDNIPYQLARRRGYRNLIVVDVSGMGNNRPLNTAGSETIYIKNSLDLGHVLDFNPEFLQKFQYLGYLDTLKVFGRLYGERFFFRTKSRLWNSLNRWLLSEEFLASVRDILPTELKNLPPGAVVRRLMPLQHSFHPNPAMILLESAAEALGMDPIAIHTPESLQESVILHYNTLLKKIKKVDVAPYRHVFSGILEEVRTRRFTDLLDKSSPMELDLLLGRMDFQHRHPKITEALYKIYPGLLPGKIFIHLFIFWRKKRIRNPFHREKGLALLPRED